MSFLRDATIVSIACQQHQKRSAVLLRSPPEPTRLSYLRKYASVQSLSSIVWGSVSRAGSALSILSGGHAKDERDLSLRIEDRKKTLYLRLRNVSPPCLGFALFSLLPR